jgi:hypothetical protein
LLVDVDIPKADGLVAAARGDVAAISGEVERVDILFMAGEDVPDLFGLNVPNLVPKSERRFILNRVNIP